MIPFETALKQALDAAFPMDPERVSLVSATGRILAEDVVADVDMPPFDKSAVDGYACRPGDLSQELRILETVAAGQLPQKTVGPGECTRIMTGAPVPAGADCVVMVEQSQPGDNNTVRFTVATTAPNICRRGEDVRKGQLLLPAGILLTPGHIAIMAAAGYARPLVARQPSVAILSTGDELVEPDTVPGASQIRNSNAYQLVAQAARLGLKADYLGIARDTKDDTLAKLQEAIGQYDVTLLTGGVSMGEFDFVPAMMQEAGLELCFQKIAIQPGKPTVLATAKNKICFGLPGNPVSSYMLFELLVKPVLYKMQGHDYSPVTVRLPLLQDFRRRRAERMNIVPVRIRDHGFAELVDYHGSAHIHAMSAATGIICVPEGITEIVKGTPVDVRQL